jgi:hypothetical protein
MFSGNKVVLIYRSDAGPKNGPKIITFVINCVVYDLTPLDTYIVLSTLGMCQLKTVSLMFFAVRCKSLRDVNAKIKGLQYANNR